MSELRHESHDSPRDLTHGWRNDYGKTEERQRPQLILIDDDHRPRPVTEAELEQQGLGHIVIASATVVPQRKPPIEESIPRHDNEEPPRDFVPDSSIFLG